MKAKIILHFWEVNEQFIQKFFPFYHIRTIKQSYNNLYFHNHETHIWESTITKKFLPKTYTDFYFSFPYNLKNVKN